MINDIKYQEVLIVPSLNMEVPVAENTNDAVYQFGAGMLVKRKIDSNSNIIIGAHNLGSFSKALFSPLANNKLIAVNVFSPPDNRLIVDNFLPGGLATILIPVVSKSSLLVSSKSA